MGRTVNMNAQNEILLGKLIGANLNSTADQLITLIAGKKRITRAVMANPSVTPTLATGGVYGDTNKSGTVFIADSQVYTALLAALKLNVPLLKDYTTLLALYFSLTAANGVACTADIYIYGELLG